MSFLSCSIISSDSSSCYDARNARSHVSLSMHARASQAERRAGSAAGAGGRRSCSLKLARARARAASPPCSSTRPSKSTYSTTIASLQSARHTHAADGAQVGRGAGGRCGRRAPGDCWRTRDTRRTRRRRARRPSTAPRHGPSRNCLSVVRRTA